MMKHFLVLIAVIGVLATASQGLAWELASAPACGHSCPTLCCPDDYCSKPYPHFFCGPRKVHCDDYCPKPLPCVRNPYCTRPDCYDCKPAPCPSWPCNTRWLKCPLPSCAAGKK